MEGNRIDVWSDAINIFQSAGNIVTRNWTESGPDYAAIVLGGSKSEGNQIFDNYFQSGIGAKTKLYVPENAWNTEPRPGRNIVGGPYIAGNYWAYPTDDGFGSECGTSADGLCEQPYLIAEHNADMFPLADPKEGTYANWLDLHYTEEEQLQEELTSPGSDPGGYGIPNVLRYLLALDPHKPDRRLLPVANSMAETDTGDGNQFLTLTFSRRLDASDTMFWFESSSDLLNWISTENISVEERQIEGVVETLTIRHDKPLNEEENSRFLRLQVDIDNPHQSP